MSVIYFFSYYFSYLLMMSGQLFKFSMDSYKFSFVRYPFHFTAYHYILGL